MGYTLLCGKSLQNIFFQPLTLLSDMYTLSVPCDGRIECEDGADESWLCTDQDTFIYAVLGKNTNLEFSFNLRPLCPLIVFRFICIF